MYPNPAGVYPDPAGLYPDPGADTADEVNAGRTAARVLMLGAVAYAGELVVNALVLGPVTAAYRRWFTALHTNRQATLLLPRSAVVLDLVSSLFTLVVFIVGVCFLIWFYKAATVAAKAGVVARRSPGWAIGGWFIPIGNLFLPYQSAVDLFPPGHPGRQMVKRWWTLWLATSFAAFLVLVGSFASTSVGLVVALGAGVLAFAAADAAKTVINEADRAHTDFVRR